MIKETLLRSNPWWSGNKIPDYVPQTKRDAFYELKLELKKDRISAAVGPRRSGKTTLMYQIINELLQNKVNPKNILYVSFDYTRTTIEEVIENYRELMNPKGNIYCFFDEIHCIEEWSVKLKNYYDFNKEFKFFITGSSSTLLYSTTESLVGRIWFIPVFPMTFHEYVRIKNEKKGIEKKADTDRLLDIPIERIGDLFKKEYDVLKLRDAIKSRLANYILWGGFPEYLQKNYTIEEWQNYLRQNFITLTLFKDIVSVYSVREPGALEDLIELVAEKQSLPLNYYSTSHIMGINKETVANYFQYLKSAHLIIEAGYYTKNAAKRIVKEKKYYIADTGLRNAVLAESVLHDEIFSKDIEGAVAAHLMSRQSGIASDINYWKDKYEVDFVYKNIPIEVKFKNNVKQSDMVGLLRFMEQFQPKHGIVITKDQFMAQENLFFIPAWMFLYMKKI